MEDVLEKEQTSYNYNLGIIIADILPILFFGIGFSAMGRKMLIPTFVWGAHISMFAGWGRVLYASLLCFAKKDIPILNKQFRYLLILGYVLMFAGCLVYGRQVSLYGVFFWVVDSPFRIFFILGITFLILVIITWRILGNSTYRAHMIGQILNGIAQLMIMLGIISMVYVGEYYITGNVAADALSNPPDSISISISATPGGDRIIFTPKSDYDTGFIFYPGAKVEYTAYAPLMEMCAERGILCILVEMPNNLAVLNKDAADEIRLMYPEIQNWYIGGHSLGGSMAAVCAENHADAYEALILLASYSTKDLSDTNLKVLSIYGTEDGVLNRAHYEDSKKNYPQSFTEIVIKGGNHSRFADYGRQEGDGMPSITAEKQWSITAEAIAGL